MRRCVPHRLKPYLNAQQSMGAHRWGGAKLLVPAGGAQQKRHRIWNERDKPVCPAMVAKQSIHKATATNPGFTCGWGEWGGGPARLAEGGEIEAPERTSTSGDQSARSERSSRAGKRLRRIPTLH